MYCISNAAVFCLVSSLQCMCLSFHQNYTSTVVVRRVHHCTTVQQVVGWNDNYHTYTSLLLLCCEFNNKRDISIMLELLDHSSNCSDYNCSNANDCHRMKGLVYHFLECSIRSKSNCELCKEIQSLVDGHNLSCSRETCCVITCMTYK